MPHQPRQPSPIRMVCRYHDPAAAQTGPEQAFSSCSAGLGAHDRDLAPDRRAACVDAPQIHLVDFDGTLHRPLVGHQQAQGMPHPLGSLLADTQSLRQPYAGEPLVRLQDEPQPLKPQSQRQLCRMQRRRCRHRELVVTRSIRTLTKAWPFYLASITSRDSGRPLVATGRTNPPPRPDQRLEQPSTLIFV